MNSHVHECGKKGTEDLKHDYLTCIPPIHDDELKPRLRVPANNLTDIGDLIQKNPKVSNEG